MKIAIASGKGGTGKTTVATNLARVLSDAGRRTAYVDCDVEEPNGAIFLRPQLDEGQPVFADVPDVDADACTACGLCGRICQYSAIVSLNGKVLTFPELCHGCGGCWEVCPAGAVRRGRREIGTLQSGPAGGVTFCQGLLHVGQAMSPPMIRAVKQAAPAAEVSILDCPPGTACPVTEALRGADLVLLVTEPTPFGLHDLRLAVRMVHRLGLPAGVVINRADAGDGKTVAYCRQEGLEVLAEIPDNRAVAEAYSRGQLACELSAELRDAFEGLAGSVIAGCRP